MPAKKNSSADITQRAARILSDRKPSDHRRSRDSGWVSPKSVRVMDETRATYKKALRRLADK